MVKEGSRWISDKTGQTFHVLSVIELEGHTWVHYILEDANDPKEFSCYLESFTPRFRKLPE